MKNINDYFEQVDLIIQRKFDKMPTKRNTAAKAVIFLNSLSECLEETQEELRILFYNYKENQNLSESEINKMNDYNKESVKSFLGKFKN